MITTVKLINIYCLTLLPFFFFKEHLRPVLLANFKY